jgi:hypothetical protein
MNRHQRFGTSRPALIAAFDQLPAAGFVVASMSGGLCTVAPSNEVANMRRDRESTFADAATVDRRGHRLPETLAAIARRDELICEAVKRFFPDLYDHEAAWRLHQALERYACSAWPRERAAPGMPLRHVDRLAGLCWHILDAIDHVPSVRTIRFILSRDIRCQPSGG